MYKFVKFLCCIFVCLLTSCEKDNDATYSEPTIEYDYYVRYEADITTGGLASGYRDIYYTVNTENGAKKFVSTNRTFNQTFGPVKKGFLTDISVDASNVNNSSCNVRIYVSRANEPFALKASNDAKTKVSTSYKIDY